MTWPIVAGAPRRPIALDLLIRIATAAGLAIDAFVHADLASTYTEFGGTINEGVLFRLEAAVAGLAAVAVLLTGRRLAYLFAFLVAGSALTVLLVARYAALGPIGPFPDITDPVWYPEKLAAAFAEAATTLIALAGFALAAVQEHRAASAASQPPKRATAPYR